MLGYTVYFAFNRSSLYGLPVHLFLIMSDTEDSAKKKGLWLDERATELIRLYRGLPVLWNVRIKDYKNRNKRHDAWMYISRHFSMAKGEIEKKIVNLRSTYLRDLKKEQTSKRSSAGRDTVFVCK